MNRIWNPSNFGTRVWLTWFDSVSREPHYFWHEIFCKRKISPLCCVVWFSRQASAFGYFRLGRGSTQMFSLILLQLFLFRIMILGIQCYEFERLVSQNGFIPFLDKFMRAWFLTWAISLFPRQKCPARHSSLPRLWHNWYLIVALLLRICRLSVVQLM